MQVCIVKDQRGLCFAFEFAAPHDIFDDFEYLIVSMRQRRLALKNADGNGLAFRKLR